jgi:hypothetical protein
MKTKDLVTIATAALGMATLTVAAFWAGPLEAGGEADAPPAKLAKARLMTKGVTMELGAAGGRTFKAGEQAEFELTAVNATDQAANVEVDITMSAAAPASPLSRTIQIPTVLWQRQECVKLAPQETRVLTLCANTNLPPDKLITVSLREPGADAILVLPGITGLSFSTVASNAAPVMASVW